RVRQWAALGKLTAAAWSEARTGGGGGLGSRWKEGSVS
ncbi:hypothetical protein A2U01_0093630, partial [Trifolium medium]|nr:hypothetical protein [Trifolium medium]